MDQVEATQEILPQSLYMVMTIYEGADTTTFFTQGRSRHQDRVSLENFYYDVIYDTFREAQFAETKYSITLRALKAKRGNLHQTHLSRLFLDVEDTVMHG